MECFLYAFSIPKNINLENTEWQEFIKYFSLYSDKVRLSSCLHTFLQRAFDSSGSLDFFISLINFDMEDILSGEYNILLISC